MRKNLILLDMFVFELKNEPYYERSKEALAKKKAGGTDAEKLKESPSESKEKKQ